MIPIWLKVTGSLGLRQDTSDSECSALSYFSLSLAHKYLRLKEPQDIKEQVTTKTFLKKKAGFTWNFQSQRNNVLRVLFTFNPLFVVLTFYESFFTKKVTPYFVGGEETICFMFLSFPISKSFIPNFCGTDYDFSSKTTCHCF